MEVPDEVSKPRDRLKTRVHGVVVDALGRPVVGARVKLVGFMRRLVGETSTDADGRYEGFIEPGSTVRIVADGDGLAPSELDASYRDYDEDLEPVVLAKPARIVGVVRDDRGGPLGGAKVRVGNLAPTTTGEHGSFAIDGVSEGERYVTVSASGFVMERVRAVAIGGETTSLDVTLRRGGAVHGTARNAAGEPQWKADVFALDGKANARADENGFYEMDGLTPGPVDLLAIAYVDSKGSRKLVQRARGMVRPGETLGLDFVLGEGTRLAGRLTDEGGAPIRALVWIKMTDSPGIVGAWTPSGGETWSEADGRFVIPHVAEGTYTVLVSHHRNKGGGPTSPLLVRENVTVQGSVTTLDLVSSRGCVVEGRVHDKAQMPAILGTFYLVRDDGTDFALLSTDDKGHFRVEGVPPGGYWLSLYDDSPFVFDGSAEGCVRLRVVVPQDGALPPLDLELVESGALKGCVLGPGKEPLYSVKLHVRSMDGHDDYAATTDFYGRFRFRTRLIPGRYRIEVEGDLALQARRLKLPKLILDPVPFTLSPDQELDLELIAHE